MNLRAALIIIASVLTTTAFADEGMWTFDNLPRDALKAKYGFSPDQAWVDHAMRASVNLGGCSASFISKEGLVLTNHHCVAGCLQQISSAKKNYLQDGFLAKKNDEEMQCPTTEVSRLEQITDVTNTVNTTDPLDVSGVVTGIYQDLYQQQAPEHLAQMFVDLGRLYRRELRDDSHRRTSVAP